MILRDIFRPPQPTPTKRRWRPLRRGLAWTQWFALRVLGLMLALVAIYAFINPPVTWTMVAAGRQGAVADRDWVPIEDISIEMRRAVIAAEDANFCLHWGFDMAEIRRVVAQGSSRGASTLTQQTAKNVFLWQARSWPRKVLETAYTPMIEALWSKRRILEVYLNVAEFGPGIFGIDAAARDIFATTPDRLTRVQAARLAAVLPSPKRRDPHSASARSRAIADGAATIAQDGRAACL